MIRKIDSNKFSLTILKVTTFSRIRHVNTTCETSVTFNTLDFSKNVMLNTLDFSKNMMLNTLDFSKNMMFNTLDFSIFNI